MGLEWGKYWLSFGLFLAGEIDITGGSMNDNDVQQGLQMLKTTAYRAQYVDWLKLLRLHAAVLGKKQSGLATWDTNFERWNGGRDGAWKPGKGRLVCQVRHETTQIRQERYRGWQARQYTCSQLGDDKNITWWCRDLQSSTCQQAALHNKNIRGGGGGEVTVQHICAKCFQKEGAEHSHPIHQPVAHTMTANDDLTCTSLCPTSLPALLWCVIGKPWIHKMRLSISRHWLLGGTSSRKWKCVWVYGRARVGRVSQAWS